jgi:hypothetical protein
MNGVTKSVILALAVTALPFAATAAEKSDKASSKDWPSFKKVDADNNGAISQDEARTVSGLSDTMTSYDKNGDGQLSKSEYESAQKAAKSAGKAGKSGASSSSGGAASRSTAPAGSGSGTDVGSPGATSGATGSGSR